MPTEEKQAVVLAVSKYGGLLFEEGGSWFAPSADNVKQYTINNVKKGDNVTLTLVDDDTFSRVTVNRKAQDAPKQESKHMSPKEYLDQDKMTKEDWAQKELRSTRGMTISYCKDLVVAGKLELKEIYSVSESMTEFITTGKKP